MTKLNMFGGVMVASLVANIWLLSLVLKLVEASN